MCYCWYIYVVLLAFSLKGLNSSISQAIRSEQNFSTNAFREQQEQQVPPT